MRNLHSFFPPDFIFGIGYYFILSTFQELTRHMGLVAVVLDSAELFLLWESPCVFHVRSTGKLNIEQTNTWRHFSYFLAFNCAAPFMLWVPVTFVALFDFEISIIFFNVFYLVISPQMRENFVSFCQLLKDEAFGHQRSALLYFDWL